MNKLAYITYNRIEEFLEKTAAGKAQEWLEAGIAQTHRGKGAGPMSEEYASYLNDKPSFYFGRTSKNSIDRVSMDKKTGKLSYTPMTRKEYDTFKSDFLKKQAASEGIKKTATQSANLSETPVQPSFTTTAPSWKRNMIDAERKATFGGLGLLGTGASTSVLAAARQGAKDNLWFHGDILNDKGYQKAFPEEIPKAREAISAAKKTLKRTKIPMIGAGLATIGAGLYTGKQILNYMNAKREGVLQNNGIQFVHRM